MCCRHRLHTVLRVFVFSGMKIYNDKLDGFTYSRNQININAKVIVTTAVVLL